MGFYYLTPKGKIAVVLILPDKVCRTFYPKYPRNSIEIVVRAFYLLFVLHARKMTLRGVFQKGNIFPRPAVLKEEKEERKFKSPPSFELAMRKQFYLLFN